MGGPDAETPDAEAPDAETLDAETLAAGGLEWLLGTARAEGPGLAWAGTAGSGEFNPSLYSGGAGIVITLLEARRHFRDDRYADAALRGSRAIAAAVDGWDIPSLYFGPECYGVVPRAGSNSSTWVRRMLLPDGSRNEVSMP